MPRRSRATPPHEAPIAKLIRVDRSVDKQVVEEGVEWIRAKLAETISRGMSEVGEYVLDRFFDGDPERVRSKDPRKNASFRSLVARCESTELPIKRAVLQRAVAIAVMRRALPGHARAYPQLPFSHQAELLPLRLPGPVEKLAERALAKKLSVRALREMVAREVTKAPSTGEKRARKPRRLLVKTLDQSLSLFTLESDGRSFTRAQIAALSDDEANHARRSAEALVKSLEKLIEKLQERG